MSTRARAYLERDEPYRNKKILSAAKGRPCTLRVSPVCDGGGDTTVWAHSPYMEHGKSGARKAHDCFGCFACYGCHRWLDGFVWQGAMDKRETFTRAMAESWLVLLREGVLK